MSNLYAVRDNKSGRYFPPFCVVHVNDAMRSFRELVNPENQQQVTQVSKYPSEFELRYLGEYDEASGIITPVNPEFVVSGATVKNPLKELHDESRQSN